METYQGMAPERLDELLSGLHNVRAAVLGDMCLDIYWLADMRKSDLSRETPHYPLPVIEERISLGGGGNVTANQAALNPAKVYAVGVAGNDWRGNELLRLIKETGIGADGIVRIPDRFTLTFCKPLRMGISKLVYEDPRLDFATDAPINSDAEDAIIKTLDMLAPQIDVLCVSDQVPFGGTVTERVRRRVLELAKGGLTVIADSRDRIKEYSGIILKPNEVEGARAAGIEAHNLDDYAEAALRLSKMQDSEVIMTVGPHGSLYACGGKVTHIPARRITGPIDIVGAGDSFLSGFSLAVGAGASRVEAAFFAGLCSEVTIQQIGTTGVAKTEQITDWYNVNLSQV